MKRILFVDDEVAVLDGLRDRLRKQRREWEMVFASSGAAALAECKRNPVDVVVSDMRMPGMDGAQLLRAIKDQYPKAVRIVLSGHAEREAVMRALPVAHQYLSKPCDAETLRGAITRACALQMVVTDENLRSLVGRVEKLPSVPTIYVDLTAVLARESASIGDVVGVVERDPAMCLKLLQVVNSAFFGLPRRVSVMGEAIGYLGIELVKALVLAAQIFMTAEGPGGLDAGKLARVQRHSVLVARLARKIASSQGDDAFMAGMLHDVGEIILALGDHQVVAGIEAVVAERRVASFVAERERLGVTHAEVGAYILGTWGVPFGIVDAVAGHHEPRRFGAACPEATSALHVADVLATELESEGTPGVVAPLDEEHVSNVGWSDRLATWRRLAAQWRAEGGV
jgi:HD-like signal output (HDOD) protein